MSGIRRVVSCFTAVSVISALLVLSANPANSTEQPLGSTAALLQQAAVGQNISQSIWQQLTPPQFNEFVARNRIAPVEPIAPGVLYSHYSDGTHRIHIAYVHLSHSRGVKVSPGTQLAPVGTYAQQIGAQVSINGNWFAPFDGPAVSEGRVYGGVDHSYTSLFGFTADNRVVVEDHRIERAGVDPRILNGVSGHPTLVKQSQSQPLHFDPTFMQRHPRTVIGYGGPADVLIMVTVDGRQPGAVGMTGAETAALMVRLGAAHALMLDGGGSTTMWVAGKGIVNQPSGPVRAVGNEIAAFSG